MAASPEQQAIIQHVLQRHSVYVNAVAGSGKTTTVLALAKAMPERRICQVTYNRHLRLDVKAKAHTHGLDNLIVTNYHTLMYTHYGGGFTDLHMKRVCDQDRRPDVAILPCEVIVIDECQDMTDLYYRFITKVIRDAGGPYPVIVLLGDARQTVNDYKGADKRFLMLAPSIWPVPMTSLRLSTTYRCNPHICHLVNDLMLGQPLMHSYQTGVFRKIDWFVTNPRGILDLLVQYIMGRLQDGCHYRDILVLAPTMRGRSPVKELENRCTFKNLPCYCLGNDDMEDDEQASRNKIIFTTFNKAKGIERKAVIVFGFDRSYFDLFPDEDPLVCPCKLYVAVTRSTESLVLISDDRSEPLPFLKMSYGQIRNLSYVRLQGARSDKTRNAYLRQSVQVTNLTRHLPPLDYEHLFTPGSHPAECVKFKNVIKCSPEGTSPEEERYEYVADITGLMIANDYVASATGMNHVYLSVSDGCESSHNKPYKYHVDRLRRLLERGRLTRAWADLYLTTIAKGMSDRLFSRLSHIKRYDWVTAREMGRCFANLDLYIGQIEQSEVDLSIPLPIGGDGFMLTGRVDIVDTDTVWEVKCVERLRPEHFYQILLYKWIWQQLDLPPKNFGLINARTGECYFLTGTDQEIRDLVEAILEAKYRTTLVSDELFIARHRG